MQGVLITNHYVRSEKFKALFAMLMQAADDAGIGLRRQTNFETLTDGFAERPDFVLFWDKDVRLARELERQGHRLFNSAAAIEACDDKSRTHTLMQKAGIRCPETV
ncbi:MAG: RimK family alpha-L-glutamate ligase, partial [Oscillospiraceae bacterium]|nr:RimK family alpha-L-glutamate ligase [Oscillospiraceae bacterium]